MRVKLFEYTRRWVKEDFEKEVNDFMRRWVLIQDIQHGLTV
ncbi:Uncharacterised protein [Streptococcus pneumoniae]|nr:Uncharacterised protein [Streptococcus pneumoniae]CJM35718.1 Uncharacterised protein [Streptococcus pneumoniae]COB34159.1 Uncharacterised protein [Streptococcus pneumoniae]COC77476.1 Uncharacterised protein [Streptococcus pneumoniae]COO65585.1 Uncharacterised protein [Streptococcus pneumoniae]